MEYATLRSIGFEIFLSGLITFESWLLALFGGIAESH